MVNNFLNRTQASSCTDIGVATQSYVTPAYTSRDPTDYGRLAYLAINDIKQQIDEIMRHLQAESRVMTVDEAAAYLNMPKATLYHKVSNKEIASCKTGKHIAFLQTDLDNYLHKTRRAADSEYL